MVACPFQNGSSARAFSLPNGKSFVGRGLNEKAVNLRSVLLKCLAVNAVGGYSCKAALVFPYGHLFGVLGLHLSLDEVFKL